MSFKAKIIIYDRANPRRLMEITESKKDGSLYIKNNAGLQRGLPPDNKIIKEQRHSIHPSDNSPLYSTIVKHLKFEDNTFSPPFFHYTNAIKTGVGFTPVLHIRYSDLNHTSHEIGAAKADVVTLELGQTDLTKENIYLTMFVGHPDSEFDLPADSMDQMSQIITARFKIVILIRLIEGCAIPFYWVMNTASHGGFFGPNWNPMAQHCQADGLQSCLDLHDFFISRSYEAYLMQVGQYVQTLEESFLKHYDLNFYKHTMTVAFKESK